jgi:hypothetical protein
MNTTPNDTIEKTKEAVKETAHKIGEMDINTVGKNVVDSVGKTIGNGVETVKHLFD